MESRLDQPLCLSFASASVGPGRYVGAVMMSPQRSGQQHRETPRGGPARSSSTPPDERALLFELWQISHFGWISETAIRRSLRIAGGHEIAAAALAERLRRLLDRDGWSSATVTPAQVDASGA